MNDPAGTQATAERAALDHAVDALEWAAQVLEKQPSRIDDVKRVCACAAREARAKARSRFVRAPNATV